MAKRKLNCYIYTRVSTELQLDGYSLEAQKERLRKEASHRGMRIVGEYSDEGKSGKNVAGRPEFRKMLADIKSGKDNVDYVLVFKLSRFGRNTADTLNSLQYMEDYGVNLLCVEDNIDSAGASGKLMISVLAAVAEIERENIKEQTMAGRQQKARDGLWNGGFAPYGYKLVNVDGQKSKMLVIDEEEAKLIRLIYEKYLQGMGVNAVAKWLNENGYTKTVRQNGTVPNISAHFVTNVLDNPVYCGKIAYGRRRTEKIDGTRNEFHVVKQDKESYKLYQGQHEAIIDEDTWYRVQVKRKKNAFKREKTHSLLHEHILSGIIKCPVCGSSMYGVVNRKKKKGSDEFYTDMWYYLCKNRKMVSGHLCDYKKHVRQDEINAEVIQLVKYVFCGENDMKDQILKKLGSDDSLSELLQEKERLTKEHEKLDSKKSKQLRRINELDIDDELYDDLMKTYRAGVQEINEQIAIIENQMYQNDLSIENAQGENLSAEVYKRIIDEMLDHIDDMPDSDKKLMMNLLIEKVEIYEEKQKDGRWVKSVQFKIPLNVDGKLVDTMFFDDDEDTENSLSNEKHVDTVHVVVNKSVYDSKNAGDRKVTVSYEISGNDAWKYIAPERSVVNGKIVPKEVNVSGITAVSRVYDKDNKSVQLSADGAKVSGYIGSDTVTVDITGAVGTMADDKAGDNKPVAITGVKLSGDNGNYVLKEQPTGVTVNISKADGSVTAPTAAADLVYNGSEQTLINEAVSSTGEVHYKLENGTYSTDLPKAVNAGSYKVYYKVIGDKNHNDVAERSINVTVNKAKLIITVNDKSAYVNDKAPDLSKPEADKDYTLSGLKGEDKITEVPSLKYIGAENKEIDPDMTKAGTVTIGASGASAGENYNVEYKLGTLTINNRRSSGGSTKYTVSAPKSTTGGSVKSDVSNAASGSTVNVTVTAEEGYKLDGLKVTDSKGNEIRVTDKGNGKYTFTMPSDKVEITPVFTKEASEIVNELPFKDVAKGAYYYDAVKWAKDNGITGGVSNDLFGSNASCTRGHIVTFLWRNAGSPEPKNASSFSDVASNSYYAKAVAWAVENGITNGVGNNKFDPDAVCTRAQSVTFLYRAIGKQVGGKAQFSDVPSNSYYADAVAWAAANDVTNGIGSGLFGSGRNCTRSQIVTFLYRAQQAHA